MNNREVDLKMKELDQLHNATLQFSKNSLEIKKIYIGLITGATTLFIKINENKLDTSLFLIILFISILFWFLDAQNYYYQEKLRHRMKEIKKDLEGNVFTYGMGIPLSEQRTLNSLKYRSLFNWSNLLYIIILFIMTFCLIIA